MIHEKLIPFKERQINLSTHLYVFSFCEFNAMQGNNLSCFKSLLKL